MACLYSGATDAQESRASAVDMDYFGTHASSCRARLWSHICGHFQATCTIVILRTSHLIALVLHPHSWFVKCGQFEIKSLFLASLPPTLNHVAVQLFCLPLFSKSQSFGPYVGSYLQSASISLMNQHWSWVLGRKQKKGMWPRYNKTYQKTSWPFASVYSMQHL